MRKYLTNKIKLEITESVKNFNSEILGDNKKVEKMCFTVCYPLSIYLANISIPNSLIIGFYKNTPHYWLDLKEFENTILDPTINQFDKNLNIVGKKTKNHHEYNANRNELLKNAIDEWKKQILKKDSENLLKNRKSN